MEVVVVRPSRFEWFGDGGCFHQVSVNCCVVQCCVAQLLNIQHINEMFLLTRTQSLEAAS